MLTDESGRQTDFVENELMVEFATQKELSDFLARWKGSVLAADRPRTAGIDAHPTYLIRVQAGRADVSGCVRIDASTRRRRGSTATDMLDEWQRER